MSVLAFSDMDETNVGTVVQDVSSGYDTMVEVQEIDEEPDVFVLDRYRIQSVAQGPEELDDLGITAYDQDTFEKGVLKQVDEALKYQKLKRAQKEQKNDSKGKCQEGAEDVDNSEEPRKQLASASLHSILAGEVQEGEEGEILTEEKAKGTRDDNIFRGSLADHQPEETEYEKRIRLGEMTPFGSVVDRQDHPSGSDSAGLKNLNSYFHKQIALQERYKNGQFKGLKHLLSQRSGNSGNTAAKSGSVKNKKSPLKKSILLPPKRRKKEKLGSITSYNEKDLLKSPPRKLLSEVTPLQDSDEYVPGSDSGDSDSADSDYKPEDDFSEEKIRRKIVKKRPQSKKKTTFKYVVPPEDWATDDSDWESSDEESRARKRRSSSKKEVDDGNLEDYKERLRLWKINKTVDSDEPSGDHSLSGGYKLPKAHWNKLYKFQKVGVQWLWELHQQGCGGLLGDEMGLGKTIQMISFLGGLAYSGLRSRHHLFKGLGPSLIVCPTTVLHQWVREFHTWWPEFRVAILHESGSFSGKREKLIPEIARQGGILVTSYSGVVQHCKLLTSRDWHYVILDEGHKIRNPDAQVTLAVKQFRTPHRIILSGSPMQNSLKELWSLFDFVFPGKLGTLPVFLAQFAVPITQGGYANASEVQVVTAFRCATVLRDTISPYLLRRMKSDVKTHIQLPPKNEQVLFCRLTPEQVSLYRSYLDSGEVQRILSGQTQIFLGLISLRKICNHPDLYSGGPKLLRGETAERIPEEERYGHWKKSGKMVVVEALLRIWKKQNHKVLLFTQGRQMLCILEQFVQSQGYTYLKLDGGTSIGSRQPLITKFNTDPNLFVFILTTRVGGLGVNLTGANRVLIYDPDWNPATDTQARERAWRIGQQNQVTVYRLITAGTIEEKVYHRQIFKQFLTNKVLNDPKQRRFFKSNDLFELFTLKETDEGGTETAAIFAGTGSEVKVNLKDKKKVREKLKKDVQAPQSVQRSVAFSQSKLERMRELARKLSKALGSGKSTSSAAVDEATTSSHASAPADTLPPHQTALEVEEEVKEVVQNLVEKVSRELQESAGTSVKKKKLSRSPSCKSNTSDGILKDITSTATHSEIKTGSPNRSDDDSSMRRKHKKHKHHKSKRRSKELLFEGSAVPNLVGMEAAKQAATEDGEAIENEDDYVLKKLFKKSGLQTVMKHDKIMEGGDADYALVEGEARRVAKEALQELKRSRQQCFTADAGVPSWTGQSGFIKREKKAKLKPGAAATSTCTSNSQKPMSSTDLLSRIRQRHALQSAETPEGEEESLDLPPPGPSIPPVISPGAGDTPDNVELLRDIRNFVAYGAVADGRASTQEIVDKFKERLPPTATPVFKFLLQEVCEFFRLPSGEGMWKLRAEFQW